MRFYQRQVRNGAIVYLDNGCFELGHPMRTDELIGMARDLNPYALVLPDEHNDLKGTKKVIERYLEEIEPGDKRYFRAVMLVLQGKSFEEIVECYEFYESKFGAWNRDRIYALPKYTDAGDRVDISKRLVEKFEGLQLHFLGLPNVRELFEGKLASFDTVLPFKAALNEDSLSDDYQEVVKRIDLGCKLSSNQKVLAKRNLQYLKDVTSRVLSDEH